MFAVNRKRMSIIVEDSKKNIVESPEYLLFMDNIVMKNGDSFLVTKADNGEIEVCMNKTIKKEDIPAFLVGMSHVVRSECFEKK